MRSRGQPPGWRMQELAGPAGSLCHFEMIRRLSIFAAPASPACSGMMPRGREIRLTLACMNPTASVAPSMIRMMAQTPRGVRAVRQTTEKQGSHRPHDQCDAIRREGGQQDR